MELNNITKSRGWEIADLLKEFGKINNQ